MRYHLSVTIKVQEYLRADGSNPYKAKALHAEYKERKKIMAAEKKGRR